MCLGLLLPERTNPPPRSCHPYHRLRLSQLQVDIEASRRHSWTFSIMERHLRRIWIFFQSFPPGCHVAWRAAAFAVDFTMERCLDRDAVVDVDSWAHEDLLLDHLRAK